MMDIELLECKTQVEKQILALESKTLVKITEMERDIRAIKEDMTVLITRPEFHPVKMISYGMAGGVLMAALGAVMSKVLGW